jgi:glycosyltransferase 2 family protein
LRCVIANDSQSTPSPHSFHRVWSVLKWVLFALVIAFVGRRAWQFWRDGDVGSVTIHWPWLVAASALYTVGWLPSVLFWHRLIRHRRGTSSRLAVAYAFFAGHLGKYIPGKASVLLIRAGLLAERGCRPGVAALTSTYETLVCMGVGAAVGLTLAPVVWPRDIVASQPNFRWAFEHPFAFGLSVIVVCIVLMPPVARVLGWVTRKLTPLDSDEAADLFRRSLPEVIDLAALPETQRTEGRDLEMLPAKVEYQVEYRLSGMFLLGWSFAFVATWLVHGLSLGCTLRAVGVATSPSDWLIWTGNVSSASFLGFVAVFAPGGLGVREAALMELLKAQPGISAAQAVAASVLLRVAWLTAEILAAAGLSWMIRWRRGIEN